jgi:RNA polymerase sigma-70 factor (ECF subfamily)
MLNAKVEGDGEPRFAGLAEAARAIAALGKADLRRLELIARARAQGLPAMEWRDLLQESIVRTLEGSRRWPQGIPLVVFLAQTMRSIASDIRQRPSEDYPGDSSAVQPVDDAHLKMEADHQLRDFMRYFQSDRAVQDLINGLQMGETALETQKRCGLSASEFDAARKRFWRGVAQASGEDL